MGNPSCLYVLQIFLCGPNRPHRWVPDSSCTFHQTKIKNLSQFLLLFLNWPTDIFEWEFFFCCYFEVIRFIRCLLFSSELSSTDADTNFTLLLLVVCSSSYIGVHKDILSSHFVTDTFHVLFGTAILGPLKIFISE